MVRIGCVCLSVLLLTACDGSAPDGIREVVHPVPEYRLSSKSGGAVHQIAYDSARALPPQLRRLAVFDESAALGVAETQLDSAKPAAPLPLVFGTLVDADVDADGRVLLLDADYRIVRVIDSRNRPAGFVGGSGNGPGEFNDPASFVRLAPDEFGVLSADQHRIERFRVGTSYTGSGRITLNAIPRTEAACFSASRLYTKGIRLSADGVPLTPANMSGADLKSAIVGHDGFVHELDAGGGIVRSFSMPYDSLVDQLLAINITTDGDMTCDRERVYVGYGVLGEVHTFDRDGGLRWIVRVTDLDHPGYRYRWGRSGRMPRSGSPAMDASQGNVGYEWINRLSLLSPELLAIDVKRRQIGSRSDGFPVTFTHRTYFVDARTGSPLGAFAGEHEVLGGGHGYVVLYREDPFPQVQVTRLR